jgi:hypothetical protein
MQWHVMVKLTGADGKAQVHGFCCKLSWRAERGLAAGFGQAAHWNSSATKAA